MKNTRINCTTFTTNNIVNIKEILYNLNMSVRKIKKSYISSTGYFSSYKNAKQVVFESVLERDFFMFLEFEKDVLKYEEQPIQIYYTYSDGKKRRYTPDTLVTYIDGTQKLFEVKYINELQSNPDLIHKLDLLKKYFNNEYNLEFKLFTDEDMNKQYMTNLKFLYKFAFIPHSHDKHSLIDKIIADNKKIAIKEILNMITPNKYIQLEYIPYIWNYIFHDIRVVDNIYNKLTMATYVSFIKDNDE